MTRNFHLCLDVRGALHNWTAREFMGVFEDDNGKVLNVREAKEFLMDEIAKGHAVIPCAPCDNFNYQTGCQGHEVPEDSSTVNRPSPDSKIVPESSE